MEAEQESRLRLVGLCSALGRGSVRALVVERGLALRVHEEARDLWLVR